MFYTTWILPPLTWHLTLASCTKQKAVDNVKQCVIAMHAKRIIIVFILKLQQTTL